MPPVLEPRVAQHFGELRREAQHGVLLGELATGVDVTLIDCTGLASVAPLSRGEVWWPRAAVLGMHLTAPEERRFDRVTVELEQLPAFAGDPGIGVCVEEQNGTIIRVALEAERRVLESAVVGDTTTEVVVAPLLGIGHAEGRLKIAVKFEIALSSPVHWHEAWTDWAIRLRDLLSLLSGMPCAVQRVTLRRSSAGAPDQTGTLLRRTNDLRRHSAKPVRTDDFVLRAGDLPGGFEAGLQAWSALYTRRRVAIKEMMDVLHEPFAYVEDRFLASTRAIAPLLNDDTKSASAAAAQSEHEAWLARVRQALPDELRDGVIARLEPDGPNDRHRLVSLIEGLYPIGAWLTGNEPETFAARVFATRAQFVHPRRKPRSKILEAQDLVTHTRALGWLLRAWLISELGMPPADLATRLRNTEAAAVAEAMFEAVA